jgi:DNA polymerase-3 subunit beta
MSELIFECDGKEVAAKLKYLTGSISRSSTMPVLSCIALEVIDGRLTARATDLDVASHVTLPVTLEKGASGSGACAAADLLVGLLSRTSGSAKVSLDGDELTVVSGGRRGMMRTLPLSEFPAIREEAGEWTPMSGAVLAGLLRGLAFCVSDDSTRMVLNGIYLSADGSAVACDGKRLAIKRYSVAPPECLQGIIIPTKAMGPIADLLDRHETVKVSGDNSGVAFHADGEGFFTKRIEGNFPDYNRVIPNNPSPIKVGVDRHAMQQAVAWAKVFRSDKDLSIKLEAADGVLTVSVFCPDRGQAEESLPILIGAESKMRVALNFRWLEQFVARPGGEHFVFEDPGDAGKDQDGSVTGPIVIREEDEEFFGLIMPMRISH